MFKRVLSVLAIMVFIISLTCYATAEEAVKVYIDGNIQKFSVPATINSGIIYVPVKQALEALGSQVVWNSKTKTIIIIKGTVKISIKPGSSTALINNKEIKLLAPAKAYKGNNIVPAEFVEDSLGVRVDCDINARTVKMYSAKTFNDKSILFDADFSVNVDKGVNWVPVAALGKPRLLKDEINALGNDPEKLQKNINTVYDAIEYIRVSNFIPVSGNKKIREGNIEWEFPKPALTAIKTNCGNCAAISNLVHYLLDGDYEEEGYATYTVPDGSGHIFNYFKKNGKYYFVDFTQFFNEAPSNVHALETGLLSDYNRSNYVDANVHEVENPQDYVSYFNSSRRNASQCAAIFTMYKVDGDSLVLGQTRENGHITDYFKKVENFNVVYNVPGDNVDITFNGGPGTAYPTW